MTSFVLARKWIFCAFMINWTFRDHKRRPLLAIKGNAGLRASLDALLWSGNHPHPLCTVQKIKPVQRNYFHLAAHLCYVDFFKVTSKWPVQYCKLWPWAKSRIVFFPVRPRAGSHPQADGPFGIFWVKRLKGYCVFAIWALDLPQAEADRISNISNFSSRLHSSLQCFVFH